MEWDVDWSLPLPIEDALVSWDGQLYATCRRCRHEYRLSVNLGEAESLVCFSCKPHWWSSRSNLMPTRHLLHATYRCKNCRNDFRAEVTAFTQVACPSCGSSRLETQATSLEPPYPPTFSELIPPHHVWGLDPAKDVQRLVREVQTASPTFSLPKGQQTLLCLIKLAERIQISNSYDPPDLSFLHNFKGNVWREYFKLTGQLEAGALAIRSFEESVTFLTDPYAKGQELHNISMAIYSLLAKADERLLSIYTGIEDIRGRGIAAAKKALTAYEDVQDRSPEELAYDIGRVHWMLGDLEKVQSREPEALKRALGKYDDALSFGAAMDPVAKYIRESRASVLLRMKNPEVSDEELVQDLTEIPHALKAAGRILESMESHDALAQVLLRKGDILKALDVLEIATADVMTTMTSFETEAMLRANGERFISMFNRLGGIYASQQRAPEALNAIEAIRCCRLTVALSDSTLSEGRLTDALREQYERLWGTEKDGRHLALPDSRKFLTLFSQYVKDDELTAYLSVAVQQSEVTSVFVPLNSSRPPVVKHYRVGEAEAMAMRLDIDEGNIGDVVD